MSKLVPVTRIAASARTATHDAVAIEEPLEIRLHGRPFSVIMRTPGADRELVAGFLLSERVIRSADDLGTIEHCRDADAENVITVTLTDPSRLDALLDDRRQVMTTSSCGMCGRRTIESLASDVAPLNTHLTVASSVLSMLPERLREKQAVFDRTGGLHAAGVFDADGRLLDVAEDVGRHNAVDKVIGRALLRETLPLSNAVLFVSGRTSFEIVQKALFAGIAIVAAVSAASSLAVDLAGAMGITLAGFVRGDGFNVYTGAERIRSEP